MKIKNPKNIEELFNIIFHQYRNVKDATINDIMYESQNLIEELEYDDKIKEVFWQELMKIQKSLSLVLTS